MALSAILYLLVTYAATIGFGKAALGKNNAWFAAASPMGTLATTYVGNWLSVLIDLVIIFDAVSLSIAIMVTASRIIFALGRDGLLPRFTAMTSRYDTPVVGNVIIALWSAGLLIWAGVTHYGKTLGLPDPNEAFFITTGAGSLMVELIYVFLALFALKLVSVALGLATPILAFKGALDPFPTFPNDRAVFFAIACIVISAVWYAILHFTRPEQVRLAARHAVELTAEECASIARAGQAQVDLQAQEVRWPGGDASFDVDSQIKHRLLHGLDDIAVTLDEQSEAIGDYERDRERIGPVTTAL